MFLKHSSTVVAWFWRKHLGNSLKPFDCFCRVLDMVRPYTLTISFLSRHNCLANFFSSCFTPQSWSWFVSSCSYPGGSHQQLERNPHQRDLLNRKTSQMHSSFWNLSRLTFSKHVLIFVYGVELQCFFL